MQVVDIYVRMSWTAPFYNYMPIESYKVLLQREDRAFVEMPDLCDGTDREVVNTLQCNIKMSVFWTTPFNFPLDHQIKAKIIAVN